MKLTGRHFLKLMDYTSEEILYLIDLAEKLKETGNLSHSSDGKKYCSDF